MTKTLLARQSWKIKETEINYLVYAINDDELEYYEVEILHETFRLRKDPLGTWTGLDGEMSDDIRKWGEVVDLIKKENNRREQSIAR
ncbi:hypothetical protein ACX0G7_08470 [Flavitalea antarctica]|jgi:hypothetical protein